MPSKSHGFRFPLTLTKEMKRALTRICADYNAAHDFPIGLRIFRAGQILNGGLDAEEIKSMYLRRLVTDDEVDFLIEKHLITDFRSQTPDALAEQAEIDEERRILAKQFLNVEECLDGMPSNNIMYWMRMANQNLDMLEAQALLKAIRSKLSIDEIPETAE